MEASFETIGALGDLGYGLIGGATFDFDGTKYTIEDFDNLSEQLQQEAADRKAREFLQAYCLARGIPIPNIDPDLPATTGKEFYKSQYFDSANRTVWNNYKLGRTSIEQQNALRFPISPQAFSDWTGYSNFWYQKYMEQFEPAEVNPIDPFENVPSQYRSYVEKINSSGQYNFYFENYPIDYSGYVMDNTFNNPSEVSWTLGKSDLNNSSAYIVDSSGLYSQHILPMGIKTCVLTNNGTTYTLTIDNFQDTYYWARSYAYYHYYSFAVFNEFGGTMQAQSISESTAWSNYIPQSSTFTRTGLLDSLLEFMSNKFRNMNIVVDGDTWYEVGGLAPTGDGTIIPDFPDVIGGNDDDPIPAYDIVFPNTSDNEGTFDITSLFDALKEAIIGASDNDDSTDSTLTREKVTDTYKDRVGEAVGEAVKTIDDVMEDSFPIQGTLNYPNLPPIPQIPLDNAFAGTTILSELIDACQQILPSPLALAFWGMIFILFIIGLIRILHK